MRIGEVASRGGVSRRSLRYYEEQGLLEVVRSPSGQRLYEEGHVRRVQLIQTFFAAGLSSGTIAELVPCMQTNPSKVNAIDARRVMERERARLHEAVREMTDAIEALDDLIEDTTAYATGLEGQRGGTHRRDNPSQ